MWCVKRVHQEEKEPLREELTKAVEESDGSLVCLKKASRLGHWIAQTSWIARTSFCTPAVLLTDWREAKPCLQYMADCADNLVNLIVVTTVGQKQFRVASRWAEGLKRDDIRIIPDSDSGHELVASVIKLLESSSHFPLVSGKRDGCSNTYKVGRAGNCQMHANDMDTSERDAEQARWSLAHWSNERHWQPQAEPTRAFTLQAAGHWTEPVAAVMRSVFPLADVTEVTRALLLSQPEHYED